MLFHRKPWLFSAWAIFVLLVALVIGFCLPVNFREQIVVSMIFLILFAIAYTSSNISRQRRIQFTRRIYLKYCAIIFQFTAVLLWAQILTSLGWSYSQQFVTDAMLALPIIFPLLYVYTVFVDTRLKIPEDEYYHFGSALTEGWKGIRHGQCEFLLKTMVKIVFLPYMYGNLINALSYLFISLENNITIDNISLILFNFGLTADLLIASFGYFFSSRLLDNHIVDTDKNLLGWLFCLLCYPPLNWIMGKVNNQQDYLIWTDIFSPDSILYWIWFILINSSWIIYWLATAAFGMGFANLSYRRLIDNGVYRYSKHPAYLAKNVYWWLYTLPFCGVGLSLDLLQNILGLTFVSLVYYGRAKSEERHLLQFSEYQEYSKYIEEHGLLSKVYSSVAKHLFSTRINS